MWSRTEPQFLTPLPDTWAVSFGELLQVMLPGCNLQRVEPSPCIHTQSVSAGLEGTGIFRRRYQWRPEGNHSRGVATELSPAVLPSAADPALMGVFSPTRARKEAELAGDP